MEEDRIGFKEMLWAIITSNWGITIISVIVLLKLRRPIWEYIKRKRQEKQYVKLDEEMLQERWNKRQKTGETERKDNESRVMFTPNDAMLNIFRSVLICGGAGSGKTYTFIKPMIEYIFVKNPCIIYDYKNPDLIEFFMNKRREHSIRADVKLLDFKNPHESNKVNPLATRYIITESHAREYANVLYRNLQGNIDSNSDPFWDDCAIALLTGCIWYMKEETPDKCSIPDLIDLVLQPLDKVLDIISVNRSSKRICIYLIEAKEKQDTKLLTNVGATLQMQLGRLVNSTVDTIFSGDEVELAVNDPLTPTQLLIGADDELSTTYGPLISLIMAVAIKQMNKANKLESYIVIDEAPTLYVPKLEELPAVARSRGIALIYCCQDISQIDNAYGKGKREALLSNLGNQFFGRSTNQTTIKYIVDFAGQREQTVETESGGESFSRSSKEETTIFLSSAYNEKSINEGSTSSWSTTKQMRNVYESSDVTELDAGEFIYNVSDNKYGRPKGGKANIQIAPYEPTTSPF